MKRKCLFFTVTCLLMAYTAFSLDLQVLQQKVKTAKTTKEKIYALDALATYYTWTDGGHATARAYGRKMITLAENSKQKEQEALAYVLNGNRMVEGIFSTEREKELRGYYFKAIGIAKENNLPFYEACAYIGLSRIPFHTVVMDADEAMAWGKEALSVSNAIGHDSLRTMALIAAANGNALKKDNLAAFHLFTQAVELAEKLQDPYLLAYSYRVFALFYNTLGDSDKALAYFSSAIESLSNMKHLDHRHLPWLYMTQWNMTWAYLGKGDMENSFASAYKVKDIARAYNLPTSYQHAPLSQLLSLNVAFGKLKEAQALLDANPHLFSFFLSHDYEHAFYGLKADLFHKAGQVDSADKYYRLSIATIGKSVPFWTPVRHLKYGHFLLQEERLPEAIAQLETAKSKSMEFQNLHDLVTSYKALDSAYFSSGNIWKAYQHKRLYHRLNDSLQRLSKNKEVALLEVQNEQKKLDQAQLERQAQREYRNRIRTYSLLSGLGVLLLISGILYRNNRQKKRTNTLLKQQKEKTEQALHELKATQEQLVQKEKMASLGELTAGIAHEIQNPLNFVNNFSEVNKELIDELKNELSAGNKEEAFMLTKCIKENEQKISVHGKRADAIVKGMLQHARTSTGEKQPVNMNALADEYLRLAYNDLKTRNKSFACTLNTSYDQNLEKVEVVPQELGRVLLNIFNNAFYSVQQKQKLGFAEYQPKVEVSTATQNGKVEIRVWDNGTGITENVKGKIFQPFFTTKPTGQGTGLGLSLSYDIITKGHGGELIVDSEQGEWAEFTITLPYMPAFKELFKASIAPLPTADTFPQL